MRCTVPYRHHKIHILLPVPLNIYVLLLVPFNIRGLVPVHEFYSGQVPVPGDILFCYRYRTSHHLFFGTACNVILPGYHYFRHTVPVLEFFFGFKQDIYHENSDTGIKSAGTTRITPTGTGSQSDKNINHNLSYH